MNESPPLVKNVIVSTQKDFYFTHLKIVNAILPEHMVMGDKEMTVLAEFISLTGDISTARFGPTAKAIIRKNCSISHAGLSNHLKSLHEKKIITSTKKDGKVNPTLLPLLNHSQDYTISLKLRERTDAT